MVLLSRSVLTGSLWNQRSVSDQASLVFLMRCGWLDEGLGCWIRTRWSDCKDLDLTVRTGDVLRGTAVMGMFWGPLGQVRSPTGHPQVPASAGSGIIPDENTLLWPCCCCRVWCVDIEENDDVSGDRTWRFVPAVLKGSIWLLSARVTPRPFYTYLIRQTNMVTKWEVYLPVFK